MLAGAPAGARPFRGSLEVIRAPDQTIVRVKDIHARRRNGAIVGALGLIPAALGFSAGVPVQFVAAMAFGALVVVFLSGRRYRATFELRVGPDQVVVAPARARPYSIDRAGIAAVFLDLARTLPETQPVSSLGLILGLRTTSGKHVVIQSDVADPRLGHAALRVTEAVLGIPRAPESQALNWRPSHVPWAAAAFVVVGASVLAAARWLVGGTLAELAVGDEARTAAFSVSEPGAVELRATVQYRGLVDKEEITQELRYEVVVSRGGSTVARLVCDPFAATVWLWSSGDQKRGKTEVFGVVLPGCGLELEAGAYTVEARRVWIRPEARSKIRETTLVVAEPSPLSSLASGFR